MKNLRNALLSLFLLSIPVGFGVMIQLGVKDHKDTVKAMEKVLLALDEMKEDTTLTVVDYNSARMAIISREWGVSTEGAKKILRKAKIAFEEDGQYILVNNYNK